VAATVGTVTIELRTARREELEAICALHNRSEAHDGVPRVLEVDELAEELDELSWDDDLRVAELDGVLAGYAYTLLLPSEVGWERAYVLGEVDPVRRGQGVGRALLGWGVERGSEQLRGTGHDLPKYLRVDSYDYIESAHRLYARLGFTPVRWFEELLRPLTDLPPLRLVEGITVAPWPDGADAETLEVRNASFADHWGSTPTSEETWQRQVHGFGSRPDLSFVAVEDATTRIVGICLNHRYEADDELLGRKDGWISTLGTLASCRGRGVASALVIASLHAFAAAGLTHASIGVDSDSPSGAHLLYRRLGFAPVQRSVTHQIEVR
jgi:mycothiol synthase